MAWRFNPPPGWPQMPPGWVPPPGWTPDPGWPPAPQGWTFWVGELPDAKPRGRSGARWPVLLVAGLAVLGLIVAGVMVAGSATRRSADIDLVTQTPGAAVRVENGCGPITLRQGQPGQVSTSARLRYSGSEPQVTSRLMDGAVVVRVTCPPFVVLGFGSSAELEIEVPPDGTVEARSDAGTVTAQRLSSDLVLHSSAGSVAANDVLSQNVAADSSAGSVTLTWSRDADPQRISAQSSAGSVRVGIPDVPDVAYRVDADSSAGSVSVDVRTDPRSDRTIRATSSAGSVRVEYLG